MTDYKEAHEMRAQVITLRMMTDYYEWRTFNNGRTD